MSVSPLHLTIFAVLALASSGAAEPAAAMEDKKPARHCRILPVGDSPPFMQEVRDGVGYELDPPAGQVPPNALVTRLETKEDGPNPARIPANIPLYLNRIGPTIEVPDGPGALAFDRAGEKPAPVPWLRVDRPESGDFMILLWRDPKEKTWNKAARMVVPDGPAGTPEGTVRLVNLFPRGVNVLWDGESVPLKPGSTLTRTITPGRDVSFEVVTAPPGGAPTRYYSNQITQNPGERGFIIIYQADGESPRRPLKVLVFREPAPVAKNR